MITKSSKNWAAVPMDMYGGSFINEQKNNLQLKKYFQHFKTMSMRKEHSDK